MVKMHALLALAAMLAGACTSTASRPLTPAMRERLRAVQETPASAGAQIYEGCVFALDGRAEPLFRYERRVQNEGDTLTSTHITRDPSGAVVVVQSAAHSPDYGLVTAEMIHGQTGVSASVALSNGRATFTLREGESETTADEVVRDPVVAGPTMFGFILAHWKQLNNGATIPIRFAVLERGETIGFVLDKASDKDGRTIIRMRPSSMLVRLAVATTYFQFDSVSRQIIEYTGRVPPLEHVNDRLETLDARVQYTFVAPAFQ